MDARSARGPGEHGQLAEFTSLHAAQTLARALEEQASKQVSEPEEHEDHDRHHRGDQTHHLEELGACLSVHASSRR